MSPCSSSRLPIRSMHSGFNFRQSCKHVLILEVGPTTERPTNKSKDTEMTCLCRHEFLIEPCLSINSWWVPNSDTTPYRPRTERHNPWPWKVCVRWWSWCDLWKPGNRYVVLFHDVSCYTQLAQYWPTIGPLHYWHTTGVTTFTRSSVYQLVVRNANEIVSLFMVYN